MPLAYTHVAFSVHQVPTEPIPPPQHPDHLPVQQGLPLEPQRLEKVSINRHTLDSHRTIRLIRAHPFGSHPTRARRTLFEIFQSQFSFSLGTIFAQTRKSYQRGVNKESFSFKLLCVQFVLLLCHCCPFKRQYVVPSSCCLLGCRSRSLHCYKSLCREYVVVVVSRRLNRRNADCGSKHKHVLAPDTYPNFELPRC